MLQAWRSMQRTARFIFIGIRCRGSLVLYCLEGSPIIEFQGKETAMLDISLVTTFLG
jgi:hypothetical protein